MDYPQIFNVQFNLFCYLQNHNVNTTTCFGWNPKLANDIFMAAATKGNKCFVSK
jgi:hypothetical protein